MSRIIQPGQLRAGDIILFLNNKGPKPTGLKNRAKSLFFVVVGFIIKKATKSKYTHAAICYDGNRIVEASNFGEPVSFDTIHNAISGCKHAAVFRSSWALTGSRVEKLQRFLDKIVEEGVPYNVLGLFKYLFGKNAHYRSLKIRVEKYFQGQTSLGPFDKGPYFCSELVAASFHAIGAIDPSAAVIYDPRFAAPADLVRDNTYGAFLGYLLPPGSTEIPVGDEFYHKELLPEELGGLP